MDWQHKFEHGFEMWQAGNWIITRCQAHDPYGQGYHVTWLEPGEDGCCVGHGAYATFGKAAQFCEDDFDSWED